MKHLYIIVTISVAMFAVISSASADEPEDVVRGKLGLVVKLLYDKDEPNTGLTDADRKKEVRKIIYDTFDFEMLSIRAISRDRKKFNDLQYDRFETLFAEILFNTYYNRIRDYQVNKIAYKGERIFKGGVKSEVRTIVETEDHAYSINYRLFKKEDNWMVYDVIIEGVSLVGNYRSQFSSILKSKSSDKLIEMLSEKVESYNSTVTGNSTMTAAKQ